MIPLDRPPTLEEAIAMLKDAIADVDEKIEFLGQRNNERMAQIMRSQAPAFGWAKIQHMELDMQRRRFAREMEPMLKMRSYLIDKLVAVMPMSPIMMDPMEL